MPQTSDRAVEGDKFLGAVSHELPATTDVEKVVSDRYKALFEPLVREARPFIGYDAACDAVNDVFLELIPRWAKLTLEQSSAEAIATLIRKRVWQIRKGESGHLSLDHEPIRVRIEATVTATSPPPLDPVTGDVDDRRLFQGVFAGLTSREMECWRLMKDLKLSAQDVAQQLGISVNTVYRHIALAKRALRDRVIANGLKISPETVQLLLASRTGEPND